MKRPSTPTILSAAVGLVLTAIVLSFVIQPGIYPITVGLFVLLGFVALIAIPVLAFSFRAKSKRVDEQEESNHANAV